MKIPLVFRAEELVFIFLKFLAEINELHIVNPKISQVTPDHAEFLDRVFCYAAQYIRFHRIQFTVELLYDLIVPVDDALQEIIEKLFKTRIDILLGPGNFLYDT